MGEGSPTKIDYRKKGTLIPTSLLEGLATEKMFGSVLLVWGGQVGTTQMSRKSHFVRDRCSIQLKPRNLQQACLRRGKPTMKTVLASEFLVSLL